MSFEPASPVSVIVCDQCQGNGCPACNQHGVYALQEDQPIVLNLPDFIDLRTRRQQKNLLLIKRIILLSTALIIIFLSWQVLS